ERGGSFIPVHSVLVDVAVVFNVLTLFSEVTDLQRGRAGQSIFTRQTPFLDVGRLDILRVHVEGAAVLHCTSRESLLRRARSSWIARSWRDGLDVHSLDEWSNRGEALVGRVALIETGGSVTAANDQTIIY